MFGVASSPFLLNATIKHHLEGYRTSQPRLVDCLSEATYVDDVVFRAASLREAFSLYEEAKPKFKQGGFNLRKFISNDQGLQAEIDDAEARLVPTLSKEGDWYNQL